MTIVYVLEGGKEVRKHPRACIHHSSQMVEERSCHSWPQQRVTKHSIRTWRAMCWGMGCARRVRDRPAPVPPITKPSHINGMYIMIRAEMSAAECILHFDSLLCPWVSLGHFISENLCQ